MPAPIPMILHCPGCGEQHIDVATADWDNPPHRSHKCQNARCGCIWRPADVETAGVASIGTSGQTDRWHPGLPTVAQRDRVRIDTLLSILEEAEPLITEAQEALVGCPGDGVCITSEGDDALLLLRDRIRTALS